MNKKNEKYEQFGQKTIYFFYIFKNQWYMLHTYRIFVKIKIRFSSDAIPFFPSFFTLLDLIKKMKRQTRKYNIFSVLFAPLSPGTFFAPGIKIISTVGWPRTQYNTLFFHCCSQTRVSNWQGGNGRKRLHRLLRDSKSGRLGLQMGSEEWKRHYWRNSDGAKWQELPLPGLLRRRSQDVHLRRHERHRRFATLRKTRTW